MYSERILYFTGYSFQFFFIKNWFTSSPSPVHSESGFLLQPQTVRRKIGLVKINLQFTAIQIYSCFLSAKLVRKNLSANVVAEQRLVDCRSSKSGARHEKKSVKKYERSEQYSKLLIEKQNCGGGWRGPKARPDASLPQSEINQFPPASRFI